MDNSSLSCLGAGGLSAFTRDRSVAGAVPGEPFRNLHPLGYLLHVRPGRVGLELQRTDPRGVQQDGRGPSGARYICITTRHHDGFSMFDSKCTDYDIMDATPFKRDIIAELAAECERQDMPLHFYYSLIDWGRTDAPRGRTGQETGRPEATDPDTYFDFMKCQLTELLTSYGKVGCIWFDGNWDHEEWEQPLDYRYDELYPLIHELQPGCLIGNNHHITPYPGEDIQIFERDIPGENTAGWHSGGVSTTLPLETCQTMNGSWGYRMRDQNYKSVDELIRYLVSTAGRDANLLLNVGPQPDGNIPAAALERLAAMGEWLAVNGETIYGTRSTLVKPQPWGVTTHKDNKMWLHVFPEDAFKNVPDGQIYVPYKDGRKVASVTTDLQAVQGRHFHHPAGRYAS